MFPNIVERLRGTQVRTEELVRGLSEEMLTQQVGKRWSIQEEVGHLWDLEELWVGRLDDILNGADTMRNADLENRKTHEADHNARSMLQIVADFHTERFAIVKQLDVLDTREVLKTAHHPRLKKPMRVIDPTYFIAEHDDHHLAQVSRLVRTTQTAI